MTHIPSRDEISFWKRVVLGPVDNCWLWRGGISRSSGYGRASWKGTTTGAHRISWMISTGVDVPPGMQICHSCDNPPCVNPHHLFLGTNADNMADRKAKGRKYRFLTPEEDKDIFNRLCRRESSLAIASEIGVTPKTVLNAYTRHWRRIVTSTSRDSDYKSHM